MNGKWQWYLGFAALILGLLFSRVLPGGAQAQADTRLKNQTLVETITQLEKEISGMEKELSALREETEQLQNNQAGGKSVSSSMQSDIELQQSLAGLTELRGPGIKITLDDNTTGATAAKVKNPEDYRPNDYIIHDKNLLYLLNELREAKVEGISINNQRIIASSDIRCVGTVIMVNSTRLAPPFEICVIGNAEKLKEAVEQSREYLYLKEKKFPIKLEVSDNLLLPAFPGSYNLKYMTPDEQ